MPQGAAPLSCLEGEAPLAEGTEGAPCMAPRLIPTAATHNMAGWHECMHSTHTPGQTAGVVFNSRQFTAIHVTAADLAGFAFQ